MKRKQIIEKESISHQLHSKAGVTWTSYGYRHIDMVIFDDLLSGADHIAEAEYVNAQLFQIY